MDHTPKQSSIIGIGMQNPFCVLYSVLMNYEVFHSGWEQGLLAVLFQICSPVSDSKLLPLILSDGSFSSLKCFLASMCCSGLGEHPGGPSADLWNFLSLQLSPLWYSVLLTLAVLAFPDYQVRLHNSETLPGSPTVSLPCAKAWKLFAGSKLAHS